MTNHKTPTGPMNAAPPSDNLSSSGRHSLPQEDVDDRENVGSVVPGDYPLQDRLDSDATRNRGKRANIGNGAVKGSGAGAGGGGSPEDYDDDPQGGGGAGEIMSQKR